MRICKWSCLQPLLAALDQLSRGKRPKCSQRSSGQLVSWSSKWTTNYDYDYAMEKARLEIYEKESNVQVENRTNEAPVSS